MAKGRKDAVIFYTPVPGAQATVFHTIYRWLIQERKGTVVFHTTLVVPTELFFIRAIGVWCFFSRCWQCQQSYFFIQPMEGGCFLGCVGGSNSD
ncbi:hypothetical protein XBKQ1_2430003 [Xenorhabdus bovienii str. kraussei Quebec]|uniref:Uncharacterized protein n=1 Tax=Xenorhabdus bovienii str. kraussei Quebec TaxID=1398203 RepID=A0A077PK09_XENBV|nr:hypothetical protein XBKQ1_2430003 [Xenorhabdus bovienii str. kraussei Quebec]